MAWHPSELSLCIVFSDADHLGCKLIVIRLATRNTPVYYSSIWASHVGKWLPCKYGLLTIFYYYVNKNIICVVLPKFLSKHICLCHFRETGLTKIVWNSLLRLCQRGVREHTCPCLSDNAFSLDENYMLFVMQLHVRSFFFFHFFLFFSFFCHTLLTVSFPS